MDVMKKKQMLATLVMLSLLQGSVYAETIEQPVYDDIVEISTENREPVISKAGVYTFDGGLKINSEYGNIQRDTAIISNTGNNGVITLNVGNDNKKVELKLNTNSNKTDFWQKTKNDIIRVNGSNITNINLKNTDMILNGENFDTAIRMDESKNTAQLNIKGDGNSNLSISGGMVGGIDLWYDGKLTIDGINDFQIKKSTELDTSQVGSGNINAIRVKTNSVLDMNVNNFIISADNNIDKSVFYAGIYTGTPSSNSTFKLNANNDVVINSVYFGIDNASYVDIMANNISINSLGLLRENDDELYYALGEAVFSDGYLKMNARNNIQLFSDVSALELGANGVQFADRRPGKYDDIKGDTEIVAQNGFLDIRGDKSTGVISLVQTSQNDIRDVLLQANDFVNIYGGDKGVFYEPGSRNMDIISTNDNVTISSDNIGFYAADELRKEDIGRNPEVKAENTRGVVNINAKQGNVNLYGGTSGLIIDNIAVQDADENQGGYFTTINVEAGKSINIIGEEEYGIQASNVLSIKDLSVDMPENMDKSANLNVTSQGTINVLGGEAGIMATAVKDEFNNGVLNPLSNTDFGSKVNLTANGDIAVQGGDYGVIAFENSNVDITSKNGNILIGATNTNTEKLSNTAAVYAENGAKTQSTVIQSTVNINAGNGVVSILSGNKGLWASGKGGTINVDGAVNINANYFNGEQLTRSSGDNVHLAVVAGLKSEDETENGTGLVDIDLKGDVTSSIYGDIVGARGGEIDISRASGNGSLIVTGDILAGNGGEVNLDIGKNGMLTGRIDDYMDASAGHGNSFFAPQFSYEIKDSGTVNLKLDEGSRWNVNGQSWVTEIDADDNSIIDLTGAQTDRNTSAHALTVGTLNGNANFRMNLDGFDKANSDMLYIKNSNGEYNVILDDAVTSEEIGETGLRFATIDNADVNFKNVVVYNAGAFDVKYKVGKDDYENHNENDIYNGGKEFDEIKPGSDAVKGFFEDKEEGIETFANEESKITNYKIIDVHSRELNNTGKTIVGMSRANYSNAIYMDRLNKRLGEARYINGEEDQGMWVRIRHDRIGKDNAFRSQNTMYELGYDEKQECDNGERRVGFAVDYMHGDTSYSNISGKGEIDRYGLWLYDTWMGDKGHYADYVAKWGHLKNDFGIYAAGVKDKITGDYSNNVFSISAEYGRKKDIGNDWYIEPQAQLQLARVTGADYVTNQNTKVSVDGINSLIGRAGFRIGKDFGEEKQSTVYLKADVLHEFLGDQDISLKDKTSDGNWSTISYENEGTWYDVGFGFATKMSKNSYAFMDFEKSFGNDNDETYQINAGVQWSF